MAAFWNWIDGMPLGFLAFGAILLALAPFVPEPHLWEKLKMLAGGTLKRPIDIFDLIMHASGLVLLGVKVARMVMQR
ncbi:MAG: hypothetical protein R3B13_33345 [Polyangiaceae bacterium]